MLKVFRKMMKTRLFIASLLPLLVSGCSSSRVVSPFNGGAGVEGEAVLLVPFREGKNFWYGESRRGLTIVRLIEKWAAHQETESIIVSGERVEDAQRQIRDWAKPRLGDSDWGRIGRSAGARFIVEGSIDKLQLKDPRSVGFFSAEATISYRVLDTQKSRTVHQRKGWLVGKDRGNEGQFRVDIEFDDRQEIEMRLLILVARRLGEELYGYSD